MENERQQELISAYLDGEVTGDEQRAVETLLANNGEARELLDELRGLQTRVRELPKFSLGVDFSQTVLDQAERTMISGSAGGSAVAATDAADNDGELDETGDDHDLHVFYAEQDRADRAAVLKRRIVWSVLAVAAALLIMVVFPEQDPRDVAKHDHGADTTAAKSEDKLAEVDPAGSKEAGKPNQDLLVSAANGDAEAAHDNLASAAKKRKSPQPDPARRGFSKSPAESSKALTQEPAPAASAGQVPADAVARRAAVPLDQAAAGGGLVAKALGVSAEAEEAQIAAGFDGVAVFEIDQPSFTRVNGSSLARDADAPTVDGQPLFRAVPLDKLTDRRIAPFADKVDADVAKAKGGSAEQVYWRVLEGTSDEIQLALAELQAPASYYRGVGIQPELAASSKTLGGIGGGGGAPARVETSAAVDAKRQAARPNPSSPIADSETPVAEAVAVAPSKPAPAPAAADDAATQPDKADTGNKLPKVNGAAERATNGDRRNLPSALRQPSATPAATEIDGLAAKKSVEAEELAKRVARFAQGELRSRQPAQPELQRSLGEAASAGNEKTNKDEKKAVKEETDREATKEPTAEKRVQPQASPRPEPLAEPSDELPSLQRSKMKDTGAEKTYRVLVVVSVQPRK